MKNKVEFIQEFEDFSGICLDAALLMATHARLIKLKIKPVS